MSSEILLIDTDVIIDYLRGNSKAINYIEKMQKNHNCYLTTITIAELYSGVRDGEEMQILDQFISEFHIAHLNEKTAKKSGLFRRDYSKNHGVGLADCMIAAIAEELEAILVTLNTKHFPMLDNVRTYPSNRNG